MSRLALLAFLAWTSLAGAVQPDEQLADPVLEGRARDISAGLRCLVCQNQSIDDSDAPLARDLRILVRERLVDGDSNADVQDYLVARYGNFILLRPPFDWTTLLLWLTAPLALVIGALAAIRRFGTRTPAPAERLSPEEEKKLESIMREHQ